MRAVFVGAFLALPLALFALLTWSRKARLRTLAGKLGAKHEGRGWLAPGALVGPGFEIDVEQVGKTYRTRVTLETARGSGRYVLRPEFFGESPDWSAAFVAGPHQQRVFLWEVTLGRAQPPTAEEREELRRRLGPGALSTDVRARLVHAKVREIYLDEGTASVSFRGVVTELARLEQTLEALRRLAGHERAHRGLRLVV